MSVAPLQPIDRVAALSAINEALAEPDEHAALAVVEANPLAVFSWVLVDGVQGFYLRHDHALLNRYAALVILFQRWVDEVLQPADSKEQLARTCLQAQVAYLRHTFTRMQSLPAPALQAGREAHRQMSAAGLARDQQRWRVAAEGFEQAFASWRTAEDPYFQSQVASDWAAVLEQQGEYEEALDKLHFGVLVATQLGDLERLGQRRLHKGKLTLMLGQAEPALHEYREAGGVFRITGEHERFVVALVAESEVLHLLGRPADAADSLSVARMTAQKLGDDALTAFVEKAAAR